MGKETKIGLAVIGVLVTVFSVLLFRHFGGTSAAPEVARAPIQPLSSAGMSKENVVVTSKGSAAARSRLWDTPTATSDEPAGQAPTASYMPAENESAAAGDPYAERTATQPGADQGAEPVAGEPASRSPFQSGPALTATTAVEPAAEIAASPDAQELPVAEPEKNSQARNPLRRLSAELPLDAPQPATGDEPVASEPALTVPASEEALTADPYSADPASSEPAVTDQSLEVPAGEPSKASAAHRDPFDAAPQAQLAPSDGSFDPQPEVQAEVDAVTGQPPAASEPVDESVPTANQRRNAFDKAEQPTAAQPASDDWQASGPVAAPLAAGAAEATPLPVENGQYTVQPGDTLWSISEKVYGTGGYFKALGARNRSSLPRSDKLTVGTQIAVPPTAELERDFASLCPKQRKSALVRPKSAPPAGTQRRNGSDVYIVNEGDTLFDIARYELGKASRWAEIYDLNRDVLGEDFDYLRPGTELVMPARAEAAAKPADSRYE
jgi:nucleoid-associated protein YgaU